MVSSLMVLSNNSYAETKWKEQDHRYYVENDKHGLTKTGLPNLQILTAYEIVYVSSKVVSATPASKIEMTEQFLRYGLKF